MLRYGGVSLGDATLELLPVDLIQVMLKTLGYKLGTSGPSKDGVDGEYGPMTRAAVLRFQSDSQLDADGIFGVKTKNALITAVSKWTRKVAPKPVIISPVTTAMIGLTEANLQEAATLLDWPVAAVKAVVKVESGGGWFNDVRADILALDGPGGFLDGANLPKILFEAHKFSKFTGHIYDKDYPRISSKVWDKTLYVGGQAEYRRLYEAMKLNPAAALLAASWGAFQILGENYAVCGYATVFDFVADMKKSEYLQLMAFVKFVKGNSLDDEIRRKDWTGFAKRYNGPGYAANKYDVKMADAYYAAGGR